MIGSVVWALMCATWRERLSRPLVIGIYVVLCASQVMMAVAGRELSTPVLAITLIFGAGIVGRDVSSGTLALVFTRPVQRSTYVIAKWLAAGTAASGLSMTTVVVQAVVLATRGAGVPGAEIVDMLAESLTLAFGVSSLVVLFSVLVPGIGDVGLWLLLISLGQFAGSRVPLRVAEEWRALLLPSLTWSATLGSSPVAWLPLVSYASTVAGCLCLATLAANRKELSYASG